MLLSTPEQRQDCKEIAKRRMTASGLVTPDPAFLYAAIISASGNQNATVRIYDGHSLVEDFYLNLKCVGQSTQSLMFSTPMYFTRGIFVYVGGDAESVTLHYLPVKE